MPPYSVPDLRLELDPATVQLFFSKKVNCGPYWHLRSFPVQLRHRGFVSSPVTTCQLVASASIPLSSLAGYIHFRLRTRQVKHPVRERLEPTMRAVTQDCLSLSLSLSFCSAFIYRAKIKIAFIHSGSIMRKIQRQDEARLSSSVNIGGLSESTPEVPRGGYCFPPGTTAHLLRRETLSAVVYAVCTVFCSDALCFACWIAVQSISACRMELFYALTSWSVWLAWAYGHIVKMLY